MEGKIITYHYNGLTYTGVVKLVYTDAVASGTNSYVAVTYMLVKDNSTKAIHNIQPRYIIAIE